MSERVVSAERYFRGIYGGDTTVVDSLAAADIVISYPIFASVLGTPAIRGREAVKAFVTRFALRWTEPSFEFHDAVCDGDRVVLVWSFRARSPTNEEHRWGGITLLRFDATGRVVAEPSVS